MYISNSSNQSTFRPFRHSLCEGFMETDQIFYRELFLFDGQGGTLKLSRPPSETDKTTKKKQGFLSKLHDTFSHAVAMQLPRSGHSMGSWLKLRNGLLPNRLQLPGRSWLKRGNALPSLKTAVTLRL